VVCDLHPGYLSTRYAQSRPGVKIIQVQHHWAHVASVLAEHRLDGPVIGIVADGTGYGTDGAVWGCECLIASLEKFERFGHLAYYDLAGADKASKEAIRPALSLLKMSFGDAFNLSDFGWLLERIEPDMGKQQVILEQIEKQVNTVKTSSLGRVFDAAAAMLGLGGYNHFDAQLPMALESIAADNIDASYDFELIEVKDGLLQLDLCKMIRQLVEDIQKELNPNVISARFHNTLAAALLAVAVEARESTKLNTVALSGGALCNRYLANRLIKLLKHNNFEVLFHSDIPSNDGGISLGQAAIAAHLISRER
jgi:hydrogenase maturation protein HypF